MLDIFNNSAFSVTTLSGVVNQIPYTPSRISSMGLFRTEGVPTTTVSLDFDGEEIDVIAEASRGAPGETSGEPLRSTDSFEMHHFPVAWSVMADEVQNLRQSGSETLMQLQTLVGNRMRNKLTRFNLTEEAYRLGVLKGIVTLKRGTTVDLFQKFGVDQTPTFTVDHASLVDGEFSEFCATLRHTIQDALGGVPFGGVYALCGRKFLSEIKKNKEYRETFMGHSEATALRQAGFSGIAGSNRVVNFGDMTWEEYGSVAGSAISVPDDEAYIFPTGVDGLFRTYYGPANYTDTVGTIGRRIYAKQERMPFDKGVMGEMQMNALHLCTRPQVLLHAKLAP